MEKEEGYIHYTLSCSNNHKQNIYGPVLYRSSSLDPNHIADKLFTVCILEDLDPKEILDCRYFKLTIHPFLKKLELEDEEKISNQISCLLVEKIRKFKSEQRHSQNLSREE